MTMTTPHNEMNAHVSNLRQIATDLVVAWAGTSPMASPAQVHEALIAGGYEDGAEDLAEIEPYVVDACRARGLLVARQYSGRAVAMRAEIDRADLPDRCCAQHLLCLGLSPTCDPLPPRGPRP